MRSLNATTAVTPEATTREIAAAPPSSVGTPGPISTIVMPVLRRSGEQAPPSGAPLTHDVSGPDKYAIERCPSSARWATSWSTPRSTSGRMPVTPSSARFITTTGLRAAICLICASPRRLVASTRPSTEGITRSIAVGLALARLLRLRDDEGVAGVGGGALGPADDAEDHRVRDVGDEQAERARAARRECPRHGIDPVVQLLRRRLDALLGLDVDAAGLAERPRHRRGVDPGELARCRRSWAPSRRGSASIRGPPARVAGQLISPPRRSRAAHIQR